MNFEKAYKELLAGKKIRRKEWEALMHLRMIDEEVIAFRGEYSTYYSTPSFLISKEWMVVDGDGKRLDFIEALEELRQKKCIRKEEWIDESFMFVDKGKLAICKPVKFDFMPTWECFNASDWELIK